jgi:ribosomal protein S18 acetylase RimI-like enzyme
VRGVPNGGLAAAALLHIDGRRGHLALLAVDKRYEGQGIENRMIGVAEQLCRAFG